MDATAIIGELIFYMELPDSVSKRRQSIGR